METALAMQTEVFPIPSIYLHLAAVMDYMSLKQPDEAQAHLLAARGWTNQEIADHMGISPNTVKQYISTTLQKLNIRQRKDLKKYMLL